MVVAKLGRQILRQRVPAFHRFVGKDSGAAVVEFALIAPILMLMLLSMLDGGFALQQQSKLNHILRAGTEIAKDDPGANEVFAAMQALASIDKDLQAIEILPPQRYCLCASNPDVRSDSAQDCSATCSDGSDPGVAYALSARMPYNGFATPSVELLTLSSALTIQVK